MKHLRQRDWILIVLLLVSSLVCVRLGFWQLARLQQRMDRNSAITDLLDVSALPFTPTEGDYQRVTLEGTFLQNHEIVLQNRALDEVAGFHLVAPLQLEDGLVILVDRGWIPYEEGSNFALDSYKILERVTIQGVLLPGQAQPRWDFLADPIPESGDSPLKTWRVIDIEGLQGQMPFAIHHQYVVLTHINPAREVQPVPDFQLDLSNGPHLSYAIQWFSFAAIAIIGGGVMLRRAGRKK